MIVFGISYISLIVQTIIVLIDIADYNEMHKLTIIETILWSCLYLLQFA